MNTPPKKKIILEEIFSQFPQDERKEYVSAPESTVVVKGDEVLTQNSGGKTSYNNKTKAANAQLAPIEVSGELAPKPSVKAEIMKAMEPEAPVAPAAPAGPYVPLNSQSHPIAPAF